MAAQITLYKLPKQLSLVGESRASPAALEQRQCGLQRQYIQLQRLPHHRMKAHARRHQQSNPRCGHQSPQSLQALWVIGQAFKVVQVIQASRYLPGHTGQIVNPL